MKIKKFFEEQMSMIKWIAKDSGLSKQVKIERIINYKKIMEGGAIFCNMQKHTYDAVEIYLDEYERQISDIIDWINEME